MTRMRTVRVGLISDTHGLLREEARRMLEGADHIVHAGDICSPQILEQLAAIAPLTAVCGNNDFGPWAERLPQTARLRIGRIEILAIHDLGELAVDPHSAGIRVVVSGHSHRPLVETRDSVLYVNPGSAGPRRFRLPISVAQLAIVGDEVSAELCELKIA
jgi:putative phosphoesterase